MTKFDSVLDLYFEGHLGPGPVLALHVFSAYLFSLVLCTCIGVIFIADT